MSKLSGNFVDDATLGVKRPMKKWIQLEKARFKGGAQLYNPIAIDYKRKFYTEYVNFISWGNETFKTIQYNLRNRVSRQQLMNAFRDLEDTSNFRYFKDDDEMVYDTVALAVYKQYIMRMKG
jgi:hypothetical protein